LTINFLCDTSAFAQSGKDAPGFSQVKHEVEKLGFDEPVEVRLQDGSTLIALMVVAGRKDSVTR